MPDALTNAFWENKTLPKHQQPYPMALVDIPSKLLRSQELHGTCLLQQHRAFWHPKTMGIIRRKGKKIKIGQFINMKNWGVGGGGRVEKQLERKVTPKGLKKIA